MTRSRITGPRTTGPRTTGDEAKLFQAEDFFALRTPLLAVEDFTRWGAELEADGAAPEQLQQKLDEDVRKLRLRLDEVVTRPEVNEAIYLASPSLHDALEHWRKSPDSKKGLKAEAALVRYFTRMSLRATPFGLFSGCSVGRRGEQTELRFGPRRDNARSTRPDNDYLFSLSQVLSKRPELESALLYSVNSSLYKVGERVRYAECVLQGRGRSYQLASADLDEFLETALAAAHRGIRRQDLVAAIVAAGEDGEISSEEAEAYVAELIDSQILVSPFEPLVTGQQPLDELAEQLEGVPGAAEWRDATRQLQADLKQLDENGIGREPAHYEKVLGKLEALPIQPERSRFLQVDMSKQARKATLSEEVVSEIERGANCLWKLAELPEQAELSHFQAAFTDRYGDGRLVPLAEVLDPDLGIGFGGARLGSEGPLVAGLGMNAQGGVAAQRWDRVSGLLMRKLHEATAAGANEIEITDEEVDSLGGSEIPRLPDAFQLTARLASSSPEALGDGDFRVFVANLHGPSGARLMGRFCHADPVLQENVEAHLRFEESIDPEAIYAEVVHLPEGRVGNVLNRPALRSYEIPLLGRSGVPLERQISLDDLYVTVVGKSVVLSSKRLGKRVIPRLTSAHNYHYGALSLYRFLGALQSQGVHQGAPWSWRVFKSLRKLPRVVSGRVVLCRAQWRLAAKTLRKSAKLPREERFSAIESWRKEHDLPRYVVLRDQDNELTVDFENILSIEAFVDVAKKQSTLELVELFPAPNEHAVHSPEGHLAGEFVVPFRNLGRSPSPHLESTLQHSAIQRTFSPGSEWLYAKFYGGAAAADAVLLEELAPLLQSATDSGVIDHWFFLRYSDPERHLRVRFHGDSKVLHRELLPAIEDAVSRLEGRHLIWRLQLETYEREVERYGGPHGVELSERVAHADSVAVLGALEHLRRNAGADARWKIALLGSDLLFRDFGASYEEQQRHMALMQESFGREFGVGRSLRSRMAKRLRQSKRELESLLRGETPEDPFVAHAVEMLNKRSEALRPLVQELQQAEQMGRLTVPLARIHLSYVHMFVNRLIRTAPRAHEAVIYDYLMQLNRSRIARLANQQMHLAKVV